MVQRATTALEKAALHAWKGWAAYRGYHICAGCSELRYCGRHKPHAKWLCVDCWDVR